jgi:integrase
MTLREYTKDFYIVGKCPYAAIHRRTNKPIDARTLSDERSRLENYILPAFGQIKLKDLSVVQWDCWLDDIESGKIVTKGQYPHRLADGTVNRIRRTFIQVLDVAKRHGIVARNVIRDTEPMSQKTYKSREALSVDDIQKLFPNDTDQLLKIWGNIEKIALFRLLLTSGLRSGEVQALRWGNISFKDNGIIVDQAVKYDGRIGLTKTNTSRILILPKSTINDLKKWKAETNHKNDNDYLFYNRKATDHIRGDSMLAFFKRILKKNGFSTDRNIVIHSFRHTFTTRLAEEMPIENVMAFTGHKTSSMVARYSHPDYAKSLTNMKKKFSSTIAEIWENETTRNLEVAVDAASRIEITNEEYEQPCTQS